jgi:hypothetical protein
MADEWAAGEFRNLGPAAVRRQLDVETDSFYSFMSERSHPRLVGLQMTIFKVEDGSKPRERQEAVLHLNDVPLVVTAAYMAVANPAIVLARLAAQAGRIQFEDPAHKPRNLAPMIRAVSAALKDGWRAIDAGLEDEERQDPEVRRPVRWAEQIGGVLDTLAGHVVESYADSRENPYSGED